MSDEIRAHREVNPMRLQPTTRRGTCHCNRYLQETDSSDAYPPEVPLGKGGRPTRSRAASPDRASIQPMTACHADCAAIPVARPLAGLREDAREYGRRTGRRRARC